MEAEEGVALASCGGLMGTTPEKPRHARVGDANEIKALFPELLLYANRWVDVCRLRGQCDPRDFVQQSVMQLYSGYCPATVSTIAFLKNTIKQRVTNHVRHLKKHPRVAIDADETDDAPDASVLLVTDLPSPESALIHRDLISVTAATVDALMNLAVNDSDVSMILMAFQDEAYLGDDNSVKRAAVLTATGLSASDYQAAIKRLHTLLGKLPPELLSNVADHLGD